MKALLVTSRVTFVPNNYDSLVVAMASCPQVAGLLVLDNAEPKLALKGLGVALSGAPRVGMTLASNLLRYRASEARRRRAYALAGKPVRVLSSVNDERFLALISELGVDLVVNARTRCIYKEAALSAPALGCINVHHGLLPDQRGVMCDLWALSRGEPAGFSIHRMTRKIDDGDVLRVVEVSRDETHYVTHLERCAQREVLALRELLEEIERTGAVAGIPNVRSGQTAYRKNPTIQEMRSMRMKGMRL